MKVTSSDINARLARGECANFRNGCRGRTPCAIVEGEVCQYFDDYVKPLLDMSDFAQRYAREAKVKLALNPNAKVVRKRRDAGAPKLDLQAETTPETPAKAAAKVAKPAAAPAKPARKASPAPQLTIPKTAETPAPAAKQPRVKAAAPPPAARKPREKAPEAPAVVAAAPKTPPARPAAVFPAVKTAPAPAATAVPAPRKPRKTEVAAEKPVEMTLEIAPDTMPKDTLVKKTAEAPPVRRQTRAPKPDDAPALELTAKPEPASRRAVAPPSTPPAAAKPAHVKEPPVEKRSIMITPQLELVLDFPLERPTRVAAKRR